MLVMKEFSYKNSCNSGMKHEGLRLWLKKLKRQEWISDQEFEEFRFFNFGDKMEEFEDK